MGRGVRIAKWTGGLLLVAALMAGGVVLWFTQADAGRARLMRTLVSAANGVFDGRGQLVIGELRSANPRAIDARDVQLVDSVGTPILTAQRVRGRLSVGDVLRGVVRITSLELDSVSLDLNQDFEGPFNLQWLISGDPSRPPAPPRPPRLGDDVRIDQIVLRHGEIVITMPWQPHELFVGAERDSVTIVYDSTHDLRRVPGGLLLHRTISIGTLVARDLHAVTPDDAPGTITIDSATLVISDPPVTVRDLAGQLQWYDDSLTFRASRVLLPDSRLAAAGTIGWGEPGPVSYDVAIDAPDIGLNDINWTWPVLPTTGRAAAKVRLRTLENRDHLEVAITDLEADAMESRVQGTLTMETRPRDFLLRDVALAFTPMTTALASRLTEDLLPPELDGRITGRFVAKEGGPLNALRIDTLLLAFEDAVTPGARSRLRASGVVAIGVNPTAQDLRVTDLSVDLRTVRTVVPDLPELVNGMVSGTARIASVSLTSADVRDLTLRWTDDAGHVSAVTGRSAVRWGGRTTRANVALAFNPFDLAAMARFDTAFIARGMLRGTFEGNGTLDSMPFVASVTNTEANSGTVRAAGWFGVRSERGDTSAWRGAMNVTLDSLNVQPWVLERMAPGTRLVGTLALSGRGRNGVVDTASVTAAVVQAASDVHTPFSLYSFGTWGTTALLVDSLRIEAPGLLFEGNGGLARDSLGRESFRGSLRMDSLSLVRAELPRLAGMMAQFDSTLAETVRAYAADSLSGDLNTSVYGEGSFHNYLTSVAMAGNQVRVGDIVVGRLFGSARADNLPNAARFVAAASADSVEGFATLRIATVNFGVDSATTDGGSLRFDMFARDTSRLRLRGRFARGDDTLLVRSDSVAFTYSDVRWENTQPLVLRNRPTGFTIDSFAFVSTQGGSLEIAANVPLDQPIDAYLRLDRFPAGELTAFALGTERLSGIVSGRADLSGVRQDPRLVAQFVADSLGTAAVSLSGVRLDANYAAQQLDVSASVTDTMGRSLRGSLTLPADLRLQDVVGDRIYTEALEGSIVADSVRLRDLPLRVADVRDLDGFIHGRFALTGTFDAPDFDGALRLDGGTLFSEFLGIRPTGARLAFVAGGDSLSVTEFRFQSGPRAGDTLHLNATVRRPLRDNPGVTLNAMMNNVQLARQRDGTDLDLSGTVTVGGQLKRPTVSANLFVPHANLVLDLTETRAVLDLNSPEATALLGPDELPTVITAAEQFTSLGEYLAARDFRVRLGNDVWVRTTEAAVKLAGEVTVLEADGRRLSLDGELIAERGTYRLDLGVVRRPFEIQSGSVRFFPQDALNPVVDVRARHIVRGVDGRDVAIDVAVGGTLENPTLALSTPDEAYSQAPESEFISLLVFGAPTFALDGQSQQTVRAVTGVLIPTLSNLAEGPLQRLLPVFNTIQLNTAGGQSGETLGVLSLVDNLSVTAGVQIGVRTYLRLNTGLCRGVASSSSAQSLNLWYGVAVEYRIAAGLTGQVGVDPGPSPCSALLGGAATRRMQVGFDLFKEWVF